MNQLMDNLYSLLESPNSSEAERRALKKARAAVHAVEQRLTPEEFEKFWDAVMDIEDGGYLDSFTLGFRLGMQLTLEGLRPIAGTGTP